MSEDSTGLPLARRSRSIELAGAQGKDFSGSDFCELVIDGQNFFESIFNGCVFENTKASQSVFQHTEFTEAKFLGCDFKDSSFDHSDFVLSEIRNCEFSSCSFQNAEWRETLFFDVRFQQCIFRNTTTSLAQFFNCSFDTASAASYVGASKRFSLYSETEFFLPAEHINFLQLNFGIQGHSVSPSAASIHENDPFFALSLARYYRVLNLERFCMLLLEAVSKSVSEQGIPYRLRMGYIKGICKVMLEESFAMKFLENKLLSIASILTQRDLVLEVMGVLFALRVAMQDRMESIEEEIHKYEGLVATQLSVTLEFENSYSRSTIEEYIGQFAAYCGLSHNDITIGHIRKGSTIADLTIAAATAIPDILRFFKYSLSFATATVLQAGKLKNAYRKLTAPDARANQMIRSATSKQLRKKSSKSRRTQKKAIRSNVDISLPLNTVVESAGPTEIFVDRTRERVLIVDGKLRVTITVL